MQPSKLARELHHEVLCALLRPRLYLLTLKKTSTCCPSSTCGDINGYEDMYHILTWPQLSYVAEDASGRIVGYILGKM
jgi:hypothetical protein